MKLASCDNCAYRKESTCSLGNKPETGEFLCSKYAMSDAFREEVLSFARREIMQEVNQAMMDITALRAQKEEERAYAG